ncbi:succinylglutamate desuccinylase/aspartoacylase family protein [Mesorhizobium sp. IMUNJ 23232]|uniref:succinylglutamate desuccinylase/aspartoacylase family protein n=1 Tax=Mesorhizobium sp. IMUNJ 23232 TaxID=3376064 RepID=UPI0037A215D4
MTAKTRIWTPIDFDADGKQVDFMRVPHSTDLSAYGWIPIPMACIRNGDGPTALLVAGNHGDEYEGQVALTNLIRGLNSQDIRGRVIVLPALNFPAVAAGRRVSPLDDANLNRSFPGRAHGTPTEMIAHYVSDVLLPMSDIVVDLHSGGRSLDYIASALVRPGRDVNEHRSLVRLMQIFGAPISFVSDGTGGGGSTTLAAAAQDRGVLAITTELGGGATLSKRGLSLAESGIRRLLDEMGILQGAHVEPPCATRFMTVRGHDAFVYARNVGVFEPAAEVGEVVNEGQLAGWIHFPDVPMHEPERLDFRSSGLVACRRVPSLTQRGDCLFKIMTDLAIV